MRTSEANSLIQKVIDTIEKDGINEESIIGNLQKAREYALKENDPLVTRALRLTWQHLESNEGFEVAYLEDAETQEENLLYFLNLVLKSENTYNRDEIREITNLMQTAASM
jgi:hypothetical protein